MFNGLIRTLFRTPESSRGLGCGIFNALWPVRKCSFSTNIFCSKLGLSRISNIFLRYQCECNSNDDAFGGYSLKESSLGGAALKLNFESSLAVKDVFYLLLEGTRILV